MNEKDSILGDTGLSTVNLSPPAMLRERASAGETLAMDNPLRIN